jgi:hypothetical protein
MLLLLTSTVTPRIRFIFRIVLKDLLGLEYTLTTSTEEFNNFEGPKIAYTKEPAAGGLFLEPAGLLFEQVIFPHEVSAHRDGDMPVLFTSADVRSVLPFDPFAAAFYMVTRYEEYHRFAKDKYGRFPATSSVAFAGGFLEIPVVHHWAGALGKALQRHYPGMVLRRPGYRLVPTIDIDHAWAYKHRTLSRVIGSTGRSLLRGRFSDVLTRFRVLTGSAHDPFDVYEYLGKLHEKHGVDPLWFILFADYGGDDNNVSTGSSAFQRLLKSLDGKGGVGIHPSLSSNKHPERLGSEYKGLCHVLGRQVTVSRQHFLKVSFPRTYNSLLRLGITDEYSMGFAAHPGFRAGIAIPYPFYDLSRNEQTSLIIHPVALMDVTLRDYLRLSREESLETIARIVHTIKESGGEFVSLWHNESLGDAGRWKGWRGVYEEMLRIAAV